MRVRAACAAWLMGLMMVLCAPVPAAPVTPAPLPATPEPAAAESIVDLAVLDSSVREPAVADIVNGSLASRFKPFDAESPPANEGRHWIRFTPRQPITAVGLPVFVVHLARSSAVEVMTSAGTTIAPAMEIPAFRGTHELVYALNGGLQAGEPLYVKVNAIGRGITEMRLSASTLQHMLARGEEHARMVALSFGALTAVSLAALLIWLVLSDRLFVLYSSLFFLQALYLAYLTGQGFAWPWLDKALPLGSHAWNVPASLSGAIACLFVREITDLKSIWPRVYTIFGGLAVAFLLLTVANLAKAVGLGTLVNGVGNLIFLGTAIFTLVVAFVAWRRGSRAAGWFLFAWTLLEACTIATTVMLLMNVPDDASRLLYYYALPLSMVAAAVLIALGVADRLREQRLALSDAERRAQTDALTGVLNRRSLIERLDAAGIRARARGLPIAVLFIDLDHFKLINDSYGHRAGDACLRAIIGPIQAELRQSDVIGRYGGEEFVVMLSSADAAAARPIAERIRSRVEGVLVEGFGAPIRMTCSIGLAASDTEGLWGEALIARADEAVYTAKRSGRNQVRMVEVVAA